ncbi:hypothetical protein NDU88_007892 [Pleurodeles waltl]|uniref:Rx N-terminal domain-containing protein n=1 Tax=Pleurodeles waltl TaxID=8319 RepID=A0AAV7RRE6_PLEWA|nr:hypothetical protein NDU88_007892 [Pleurodeles waltl]
MRPRHRNTGDEDGAPCGIPAPSGSENTHLHRPDDFDSVVLLDAQPERLHAPPCRPPPVEGKKQTDQRRTLSQSNPTHWVTPPYHPMKLNQLHALFLETLFGALCTDIATLKQDLLKDIKGLTKDMNELGDWVDTLERTSEAQGEELDGFQCETLELQDKNAELRYQVKVLENRTWRANIRIKRVTLQAAGGNLKDYTRRLFHHIAPELAP